MKIKLLLLSVIFISSCAMAQELNITDKLRAIENGEAESVRKQVLSLREKYPDDPSVLFLEAVLTTDARDALQKYNLIVNNYPQCKYADAALYRIYSYYYAIGLYAVAENYSRQLKQTYSSSPYLKYLERKDTAAPVTTGLDEANAAAKEETAQMASSGVHAQGVKTAGKTAAEKTAADNKGKQQASAQYKYTVQAGAFLKLENAENLKRSFEARGYVSEISLKDVAGSTLNVVTVGRYKTEAEARKALDIINRDFKVEGRVAQINN